MHASSILRGSLLGLTVLGLGACQQIREDIGIDKTSPDEFRVIANAPLAIPPDYNLRPPAPGAARPQEATPTEQARVAVFGPQGRIEPGADPTQAPTGDQSFLDAAGAEQVPANIRQVVDGETQQINASNVDFIDSLIFWKPAAPTGSVVDASSEADRIRETQALGQPVTTGDTPIVITREKGILEDIF
ncbi:MAG: DUF3035 domain-containing protein [Rhodospirillales bacterium]